MPEYHGILVDEGFEDKDFVKRFKVLGSKKSEDNPWTLYRIKVPAGDLQRAIKLIQKNIKLGYYAHLYRGNELIVVFRHKVFRVTPEESTWGSVIAYGLSVGIPPEQLDMKPCRFEDETY